MPEATLAPPPARGALRDIYVARQAIYDRNLDVIAYEVLYRNSTENRASFKNGDQATSELLLNAVVEIGLEHVVGERLAFVNLTRDFLIGRQPLPLENQQLVLEILEDVVVDDELIAGVSRLVSQGYTLALDDAVFRDELKPLLNLAKIVKVELPAISKSDLPGHVRRFRDYPVKLLAEKVETREEFQYCQQLGFEYFQGYFLSRPQMLHGKQRPASHIAVLKLLAKLSDPDVTIEDLEAIIRNEATISYKLLRYINSSKFAMRGKIDSLRRAILLVGLNGVRSLAMLVSLSSVGDQPGEILKDAMQRAVFCERLGRLMNSREVQSCFTAGLLSSFDAIFDMPLEEILKSLPLSEDLKLALLKHQGPVGETVRCAIAHERADWHAIKCGKLTPQEVRTAWLAAIEETNGLWSALLG